MSSLIWSQSGSKLYNADHVNEITNFILNNMRGMLPLFGIELKILENYAEKKNIPLALLKSTRNHLRSQKDIKTSRYDLRERILKKFTELTTKDTVKLADVVNYFKSINQAPVHVIKILNQNKLLNDLPETTLSYFKFIQKLLSDYNRTASKAAGEYEIKLENYLESQGLLFSTEEELRTKGMALTPDILFDKPITLIVDGLEHKIAWLDAKCFFLSKVPFIIKNIVKQNEKYTKEFGPGAFVLGLGFDKSIHIPNVLLLATDAF